MDSLREQLDAGKMHYFVSFLKFGGYREGPKEDIIWIPAQGVINRHPFEFIRDHNKRINLMISAVLVSYQSITEEEYELYSKEFNHE